MAWMCVDVAWVKGEVCWSGFEGGLLGPGLEGVGCLCDYMVLPL